MLELVDVLIFLTIAMAGVVGFKRGFVKQTTMFVGLLLVIVLAFILKEPIANFMFAKLPFFDFFGLFKGITVLTILLYEMIAFFLVLALLIVLLKIFTFFSGIIEKILNFTIILGIPSKLFGAVVGLIEGYVLVFLILFFLTQPSFNLDLMKQSRLTPLILNHTPILSTKLENTIKASEEIYALKDKFSGDINKEQANREALEVLIKHKIISVATVDELITSGKLKIAGIDDILNKYR